MKVLFAVSNENISTQIVKKYQREYKEIISYKNMYYFNAIIKELQRDKSYDRIVISEDLEPFANNNFDEIEKFLFEKLDSISDEATDFNEKSIPIILLASDKRTKSEQILVKLFGIGIYNVLLGKDRNTDTVCALLNKPRSKKEAKSYYKIEAEEVSYKSESEDNVSEAEIKNILNHYRRLGKDEERFIESFNNIAAQYNDAQLRIITKFLPLNVKAVLEEKSPKYQSVMTFSDSISTSDLMQKKEEEEGLKIGFLNYSNSNKPTNPVIVPTAVKKVAIKQNINNVNVTKVTQPVQKNEIIEEDIFEEIDNIQEEVEQPIKRGRGRPKKIVEVKEEIKANVVKRGRGRPRKVDVNLNNTVIHEENNDTILPGFNDSQEQDFKDISYNNEATLPGFDDIEDETLPGFENIEEKDDLLPGFEDIEEKDNQYETLPGFDDVENETLPGFENVEEKDEILPGFDEIEDNDETLPGFDVPNVVENNYSSEKSFSNLISSDKKIVSFVGTTKNGTSFIVNNLAKCLSSMGIKTAILDLTANRNSYYIYTKNQENLRNIAYESIKKLKDGMINGIPENKYLDIFTGLPGDRLPLENVNEIVSSLAENYSIVLMDCDFNTPAQYFKIAQEIYIVQSMDILTIQPMTAFLRDLKAKDTLNSEKIRVIVNKEIKVKGLTPKMVIGGLAYYNDPAMAFMTELFNRETVKYCTIPFSEEVCSKYLEGVMNCEISINGYPKTFVAKLKELANTIYPLIGNKNKFSANMNDTLEKMKNKY